MKSMGDNDKSEFHSAGSFTNGFSESIYTIKCMSGGTDISKDKMKLILLYFNFVCARDFFTKFSPTLFMKFPNSVDIIENRFKMNQNHQSTIPKPLFDYLSEIFLEIKHLPEDRVLNELLLIYHKEVDDYEQIDMDELAYFFKRTGLEPELPHERDNFATFEVSQLYPCEGTKTN